MFKDNLSDLRKLHKMSQEELAERVGVSRQTLSKWETGESLPDIGNCLSLAQIFGVTIDDLVSYESSGNMGFKVPPKGKHMFGIVTVGEKGQIVLPAKARKIFNIVSGDKMVVLGDEASGIALIKENDIMAFLGGIRDEMTKK